MVRREGGIELELPESPTERGPARRRPVFYNAAMVLDRDLNVAVLERWGRDRPAPGRGWEMLAATGVRGLRLIRESSALSTLLLTENGAEAERVLASNAARVGRDGIEVRLTDARTLRPASPFDYVDLDPFGSPAPFLEAAIRSVVPGGLLAVTATDMLVLAGAQPEACGRRYGARPVRGRLGPEGGLRILLAYIARRAAEGGAGIRPLLGYVLDHHLRAYVTVGAADPTPPVAVWPIPPEGRPPLSGRPPFGPLWTGPLFDPEFVEGLVVPATAARPRELGRLLERFREESRVPAPFYFEPNEVARIERLARPPPLAALLLELRRSGFRAARSHMRPGAFRTDAPADRVGAAARALADRPG
ncbi:MAG: hypothetical protein ACYDFT_07555 [Thermoplasmata archaeon]